MKLKWNVRLILSEVVNSKVFDNDISKSHQNKRELLNV